MCKFHKDVAREIATDPQTGKVNKTKYQIALVSLAKWWVEQYLPTVSVLGYSSYELATQQAQDAFNATELPKTETQMKVCRARNLPFLREAINKVVEEGKYSFSFSQTKLDKSMTDLYDGDPYKKLTLVSKSPTEEFETFRQAIDGFLKTPEVEERLKSMLEHNIAKLFQEAPQKVNRFILGQYEKRPSIRNVFNACACGMGAGGGFLASHAGCIISPSLSFATAAGGAMGSVIAIGASFSITALGLYLWHKVRGEVASKTERRLTFASAFMGATLAVGLHLGGGHAGHSEAEHLHEAKVWVETLPPSMVEGMKESAKAFNISWDDYLAREYEIRCGKKESKPQTLTFN